MANAAGGRYQVQGGPPQFPAYASAATGGQYYQQTHQQPSGFQYYAPPPPQPPAPPGPGRFGMAGSGQQSTSHQQPSLVARNPPPPPPPPPGETLKNSNVNSFNSFASDKSSASLTSSHGGYIPPLRPPPLPPMFPWMSPALAESMTSSQFGQNFREEASNLPFVPIIVNDADLAKMTENVIKEAEQVKSHQLQYYKDVINQDLPQPLKDMFQPLYCKLCTLTLSSPVVAKDHYSGKRHKKAVEAWIMKNPQLCTVKQKRDAAAGGGGQSQSVQPASGTFVKTPGGGIGLTGPINGYIMKHNPNQNQAEGAGSLQPKPTPSAPPPPSLFSLNLDNNRKRPAPSPPVIGTGATVGAPVVNTQHQQRNNPNDFNSQSNGSQQKLNQFMPSIPPQLVSPQTLTKPTVPLATGVKVSSPSAPVQQNFNQGQGPTWKLPENSNKNDADFQAKRPRRDDFETVGNLQPGAPQQPRERGGSGQGGGPPPQKMCEICNVQLSSMVMAEQHFNGKNHKAKLAALNEGGSADAAPPATTGGESKNINISAGASAGTVDSANNKPKEGNSIVNKLLAISSQSVPQIPPTDLGGDGSFFGGMEADNPFQQNQQFNNTRGGGGGGVMGGRGGRGGGNNGPPGRGGANNGPFGRGGGNNGSGGGRGGGNMVPGARGGNAGGGFGGRGGGNPNNNRGGGGGNRGGGGGGGGPVFRNNSNSNNNSNNNRSNNNFNNKTRFNNNNSNRGRR